MRIRMGVVEKMRGEPKILTRLSYELNKSQSTIYRWLAENRLDGDLTKFKALQIISSELNIPPAELLEDEKVTV